MAPLKNQLSHSSLSNELSSSFHSTSADSSSPPKQDSQKEQTPRRQKRVKVFTLVPGSPFYDAFFGDNETLRESFNQEEACDKLCNSRQFAFQRQDSSDSNVSSDSSSSSSSSSSKSSSSKMTASKQGRPFIPRYGSF